MEKNMRTDHDKGPDWSVVDNSLYAFVRKMGAYPSCTYCTTYAMYEGIQLCLHCGGNAHLSACLLSPLSQFCSLADCSAPSLVAAPPSSPSQWCWALVPPSDTLSHSPVTEQRGWGWTTGDPDMRTCNEVHCHNQELQHPGSATRQLKSSVQPWVIENCWVSYGGTNIQLTTRIDKYKISMQTTNFFIVYHSSQTSSSLL